MIKKGTDTFTTFKVGKFSTADVRIFLQQRLGFPIDPDFRRYIGPDGVSSYVVMRVGIEPKYFVKDNKAITMVDKILRDNGKGYVFNMGAAAILARYAFPKDLRYIDRKKIDDFGRKGVTPEVLVDIINNSKIGYSAEDNRFGIYLRPEAIISDLCKDPLTNSNGDFKIVAIDQDPKDRYGDTIVWTVKILIDDNSDTLSTTRRGNLDVLFSTIQR